MVELTFIARVSDGLILVETWDAVEQDNLQIQKKNAKKLLMQLRDGPPRCSVDSGHYCFHYITDDIGLVYLSLTQKNYPKKLAYTFLDEIKTAFTQMLQSEWGTSGVDYRVKVDTIEKPYAFIKFDRVISNKKKEYRDPHSSRAMSKLQNSLTEVTHIMQKNIEDMVDRGGKLDQLQDQSSHLRDASEKYKHLSKDLAMQALLKKYGPFAVLGFFILLILYIKLF